MSPRMVLLLGAFGCALAGGGAAPNEGARSAASTQSARNAASPSPDVVVERDVMVPMRDGVRLATDVYRPARGGAALEGEFPILLQRTPYGKSGGRLAELASFFARSGYVVAVQDCRGRYRSEGVFSKYVGEGADGHDTVEWLARLPYADGQVGMWGTSYAAHVQAAAAKTGAPHLRALLLNMGGFYNGWDHKIRNHGAFENQQLTWAFREAAAETRDPVVRDMLRREDVRDWLAAAPLRKGLSPLAAVPAFEDQILEMMTHGDYDDFWKHPDINWAEHYGRTADVPMVHVSGWYDSYCGGSIRNWVELAKVKKSAMRLVVGPWTHGGNTSSFAGEVEFGPEARRADFYEGFHLAWFDRFLKGGAAAQSVDAPVEVFVMGGGDGRRDANGRMRHGGAWRRSETWPLPGTRFASLYFHADGSLRTGKPPAGAAPSRYAFDPRDPVPTIGGSFSSTSPAFESGAYDQRERAEFFGSRPPYLPLRARSDVLVFQTAPLESDVEVVGPVTVRLFVSSSAADTDFTAKLVDVHPPNADYPSGFEMNLTDGIVRARYRASPARQELMKPGIVYEIVVEPFPTANLFKKGHRIRVDVSSSNFPRFDVNPNTGEPLGRHRALRTAENTIYHDAARASHVVLPIVGARE